MRLFLIGHDNSGSQAMFKSLLSAFPDATFELAVTTGLYYRKTLLQSIVKMLRESETVFCASRAIEMFLHRIKGESLGAIASAAEIAWFETSDIDGRRRAHASANSRPTSSCRCIRCTSTARRF